MSLAAPLALVVCCAAALPVPQQAQRPAKKAELPGLREFLERHDRLVNESRIDELRDFYAPDFLSPDLGVVGRDEMLRLWDALTQSWKDIQLETSVIRVDDSGPWHLVSACRPFRCRDSEDDRWQVDDFCETVLVHDLGEGKYQIAQILEMDHDKLGWLAPEGHVWTRTDLGYSLTAPAAWLTVAHRDSGSRLDKLVFLQPAIGARIDFSLLDPTLPLDLEGAVRQDLWMDARCRWRAEPRAEPVNGIPAAYGAVGTGCCATAGDPDDLAMGAWYLSPDRRILFAFTLKAPDGVWAEARRDLEQLVGSLTLTGDPADFTAHLFAGHPRWQTVQDGIYEHPTAPLSMEIPDGLRAVPLAGTYLQRLRLDLVDDPGSSILLQVVEPQWMDEAAEKRLEESARRLVGTVCSPDDTARDDETKSLELLGVPAPARILSFQCGETGTLLRHRLICAYRDGYLVQLVLVAGSDRAELQQEKFEQVVAALLWD